MPSIEQYKMFIAVAESNSLRSAAKKIYKSQPTVTTAIKKMEDELSITLFDRHEYRLRLTEQGKMIYRVALNLLANHDAIGELANHYNHGEEPILKIAVEASFDLSTIISELKLMQEQYSSTQVVLQQEYISGAIESILDERTDLAFTPVDPIHFPIGEVEFKHLYSGQFINVASRKLIQRHPSLTYASDLINEYLVVIKDSGTITSDKITGLQPGQRTWYVNNFETKSLLIQNGLGWGSLPRNQVEPLLKEGKLVKLSLDDFPEYTNINYCLVKLKSKILGPIATTLWDTF
ncbi:MAG: LysR family transcriptional regulator [Psychrobium sp.]